MLAQRPPADVVVPALVLDVAGGRPLEPVWMNELGGLTFLEDTGEQHRYLKWSANTAGPDLAEEADRMRWLSAYSSAPQVLALHTDAEGSILVTLALRGENAVSPRWSTNPAAAVPTIGAGLRALHDRARAAECPYSWSVADQITSAEARVSAGITGPSQWHPEHLGVTTDQALDILRDPPEIDRLVVCHGDACAPNTIIDDDGGWSGHVDLGALGVADRWADLAIATWSTEWNYGPGWQGALLDAYGIAPDHDRIAYYRLLWDLS
ncbi:MAG: aminoglycoside 3'-phosphotransferase [Microthrixaceae bacterium]